MNLSLDRLLNLSLADRSSKILQNKASSRQIRMLSTELFDVVTLASAHVDQQHSLLVPAFEQILGGVQPAQVGFAGAVGTHDVLEVLARLGILAQPLKEVEV